MLEFKASYFQYFNWHQWYFVVSFLFLVLATVKNISLKDIVVKDVLALFKVKEDSDSKPQQDVPIYLFSFLQLSLFFFLLYDFSNQSQSYNQIHILSSLILFALFVLIQWLLERLLIYVVDQKNLGKKWQITKWSLIKLLGIVVFVLNLFMVYMPFSFREWLIYGALVLFFTGGVILFIRLLKISKVYSFPIWFIILYFCALEIMPIALLVKRFLLT